MTKHVKAELDTRMLEIIMELEQEGRLTTAAVVETVLQRYPELCDQEKDRLFRGSLSDRGRRLIKSASDPASFEQLVLPDILGELKLPTRISLPRKRGTDVGVTELSQADDVQWVLLREATFSQLTLHISFLQESIGNDQARLWALQVLHDYLQPAAALEEGEPPLEQMLARLRDIGQAARGLRARTRAPAIVR